MKQTIQSIDSQTLVTKIKSLSADGIIFLVDEYVWELYQDRLPLETICNAANKRIILKTLPRGEKAKSFDVYERICEELLEEGIHRNFHVIACGGGATSDVSGFIAASLKRSFLECSPNNSTFNGGRFYRWKNRD